MDFYEELVKINGIIDGAVCVEDEEEWTLDHSVWLTAWLISEFGEGIVGDMLGEAKEAPKVTPKDAAEKMAFLFKPPGFVVDTPFPDTWDMWWASVADLMSKGGVMKGGKPNYEGAMRGWKNRVEEKYGFRPTRTKERSMTDHIKQMAKGASKVISSKKKGMHVPKEIITQAARLMQGAGIQKKRKAEYERLQKALRPGFKGD